MKLNLIDQDGNRIKGGDEIWPNFIRRFSIPVAKVLHRAGVNPLMIVAVSFCFGFSGFIAFFIKKPTVAAFLCLISWFLDFVDGDLSRKSNKVNNLGDFFDSVNGKLFSIFVFGGATVCYVRMTGDQGAWVLGFLMITGIYLFMMVKAKADLLDPEIHEYSAGLRHHGTSIEKPAWKFLVSFLFSGLDFLLLYALVTALMGRLDYLFLGCLFYVWSYVVYSIFHGFFRIGGLHEKKIIKTIFCYAGFYTGLFLWCLTRNKQKNEAIILMYHHVRGDQEHEAGGVSQSRFREQMQYFKKNFGIGSLHEFVHFCNDGRDINRTFVAITFDDGFEDFYLRAYPVLCEHNLAATVYLVSHAIESHAPIWTERVESIIRSAQKEKLELRVGGVTMCYALTSEDEKQKALDEIKERLKDVSDRDRNRVMEQLDKAYAGEGGGGADDVKMLSWAQIRELKKNGIDFGAHTMTHPILTKLQERDAYKEIVGSKQLIEDRLESPVEHFCYPNGERTDFNDRIKQIVKEAGFTSACTTILGRNPRGCDLYELKRIYVKDEPLPYLVARICGVIR